MNKIKKEDIDGFITFLIARNLSPKTIELYTIAIHKYLKKYHVISGDNAIAFFESLTYHKPNTVNAYIKSLSSFCNYLIEVKRIKTNPFASKMLVKKRPVLLPKPYSDTELTVIEHHLPYWIMPYYNLMLYGGLRLQEATRASRLVQVMNEDGNIRLKILGKGTKERIAPYIKDRLDGLPGEIHERKIKNFFYYLSQKLGFTVSAHRLRHTYASRAINLDIPVEVVSKWLGHSSLDTTMQYVKISPQKDTRYTQKYQKAYA